MGVIKIAGDQWPPLIVAELFKPYEVVIGVHKVHIIKEMTFVIPLSFTYSLTVLSMMW